jgi:hypothetical protein
LEVGNLHPDFPLDWEIAVDLVKLPVVAVPVVVVLVVAVPVVAVPVVEVIALNLRVEPVALVADFDFVQAVPEELCYIQSIFLGSDNSRR